jgi:short-subunit dehydrogenase
MVANRVKGHVIFVGSFLGYTSFVGYSQYSSGKYALRGVSLIISRSPKLTSRGRPGGCFAK